MSPVTIYACENQPIVEEGLSRVFDRSEEFQFLGYSADFDEALRRAATSAPDIFLLGQPSHIKSVLPLISQIKDAGIPSRVVLWVNEMSEVDQFRALQLGARGIVIRTQSVLAFLDCLRTIARGAVWFQGVPRGDGPRRNAQLRITPRERQIVEYICKGLKNKEIAEALSITPGTVKVHLMHIFEKSGVKDRFELALQGSRLLGEESPSEAVNTVAEF